METYHGHVRTPHDAIILFEACRLGLLPRVQRRLSEKERQSIRSGSVFVWDEREAGMRRWTDGKSWSASRVAGSFLNYREMEGKRGGNPSYNPPAHARGSPDDHDAHADAPADGYRYKPDGLIKQSFSITTNQGQHLHLISYYARSDPNATLLLQPSTDPNLRHIHPAKGMYPDASIHDNASLPPVTRSPMASSFSGSPQSQYAYAHRPTVSPGYGWPPSPMHTPPAGQYSHHPGSHYPNASYFSGQPSYAAQPRQVPTAFDRAPPAALPPPMGPAYSHGPGLPAPQQQQPHPSSQYPLRPLDSAPPPTSAYPPGTSRAPLPQASASTIPSINSLINRSPEPMHVSPYHHPGAPPRPSPPGGERQTLGTEKSGFREDLRALRQLDRNFT